MSGPQAGASVLHEQLRGELKGLFRLGVHAQLKKEVAELFGLVGVQRPEWRFQKLLRDFRAFGLCPRMDTRLDSPKRGSDMGTRELVQLP